MNISSANHAQKNAISIAHSVTNTGASHVYGILSGIAGVACSPLGTISVGVSAFSEGKGIIEAVKISVQYLIGTIFSDTWHTIASAFNLIAGVVMGAALELFDRCICFNPQSPAERGSRLNNNFFSTVVRHNELQPQASAPNDAKAD